MEQRFIWDEIYEGLNVSGLSEDEDNNKKVKKGSSETTKSKIYCPHQRLIFNFKDSLNFNEQNKFRTLYQRKGVGENDVVLLQDVKDLALYEILEPVSLELVSLVHLPVTDRFLRALLLYLQSFVETWIGLGERRAACAKRAPNPLAGGARLSRAREMHALRQLLAREYVLLLLGCHPHGVGHHHMRAGEGGFAQSNVEHDFRLYEGLIQLANRIAWIALRRKHAQLLEVEINRLFRSDAYNTAKRKCAQNGESWEVPEDEHWILYGPKMPQRRKILENSPLPYELLYTNCDFRILSLGLSSAKTQDPRLMFLENVILANERDFSKLGIKLGILGLPRSDFDLLLIPQANDEDEIIVDEPSQEKEEDADDYETLLPPCGSGLELAKKFPISKVDPRLAGDEKLRKSSRRKWIIREQKKKKFNDTYAGRMSRVDTFSLSMRDF